MDTNVFVSGLFGKGTLAAKLQDLWIAQEFELVTSLEILREVSRVLHYPWKVRRKITLAPSFFTPGWSVAQSRNQRAREKSQRLLHPSLSRVFCLSSPDSVPLHPGYGASNSRVASQEKCSCPLFSTPSCPTRAPTGRVLAVGRERLESEENCNVPLHLLVASHQWRPVKKIRTCGLPLVRHGLELVKTSVIGKQT
ncbi:MAG: PIN domain-containing protein [Deltaproteobacteria bacterium]|nr:PIN domain-containing protein [Deltaproteobacteria bacterium]